MCRTSREEHDSHPDNPTSYVSAVVCCFFVLVSLVSIPVSQDYTTLATARCQREDPVAGSFFIVACDRSHSQKA